MATGPAFLHQMLLLLQDWTSSGECSENVVSYPDSFPSLGTRLVGAAYHGAECRVSVIITESVDSVCRDGTDMPYVAIQTEAWKTLLKQQL